jgi:hypothetical protein
MRRCAYSGATGGAPRYDLIDDNRVRRGDVTAIDRARLEGTLLLHLEGGDLAARR